MNQAGSGPWSNKRGVKGGVEKSKKSINVEGEIFQNW